MKIGCIIATQGTRPYFFNQCMKYVDRQTVDINFVHVVDEHSDMPIDLTWRCKHGVNWMLDKGADLIFFIEEDDWYRNDYIEIMIRHWESNKFKHAIFGNSETIYYHIGIRRYVTLDHPKRASLFHTMITASAARRIKWPPNDTKFLDIELWKQLGGLAPIMLPPIAIGIKHGMGNCISTGQDENSRIYHRPSAKADKDLSWLQSHIGDDIEFYKQIIATGKP